MEGCEGFGKGRGVLVRITGPFPRQEGSDFWGAVRHGAGLTGWHLILKNLEKQPEGI